MLCSQIVEILFARGLVKVLFATETFAMVGFFHKNAWLHPCFLPPAGLSKPRAVHRPMGPNPQSLSRHSDRQLC